jgi:hypothetical protein
MNMYKKAIIYNLKNNKTFAQIQINNNNVQCKYKIIQKDIEIKLSKIKTNIKLAVFYVSLYDYDIIKKTYFWDIVNNIQINQLPIYKKSNDLYKFILWYSEYFNNVSIEIFATNKFTKRKHVFDDKEKCLKSIKWECTNNKFPNFLQLFYNAGDFDDIEKYAYIYIRSFFNNKLNHDITSSLKNNVFNVQPINIWKKFHIDFLSIKNTIFYMMNKMKKGVLICIKNNKLYVFLPFSKHKYVNDYYTELYFDNNDKQLLQKYHDNTKHGNDNYEINKQLINNTKNFFKKFHLSMNNINFDRTKWVGNDCFFRYEDYEGDKSVALYEDFFVQLCKNRIVPDSIFILNVRDHPVLHKNLKDAYVNVVDRDLDEKYKFDKYIPILSVGASTYTSDIPLVTQDDWLRVSKKIYPDDCKNGYIDEISVKWTDKINKCVFRGSATGCFMDDDNIRIKATKISNNFPELLDAGITSFNKKIKKNINKPLSVISTKLSKASFMSIEQKAKFKYILNLDGHVSAFRLGHELSLGSVVLIPKSNYYLWFSYLLVPYTHFVPIKEDLSDLISQIKWCINNDSKCKEISNNALNFFNKYLTEKGIFDYMQKVLSQISFKSLNFKKYSMNIAIILVYRNSSDDSRLVQKRKYIYWMNNILRNICNYDIIVVEQNYTEKFNIGKLKNIGFHYLTHTLKKQYDNFIFSDIDMIPDSDLLPYFFKITNSVNALAHRGTRYEQKDNKYKPPFAGGIISCTAKIFQELNGYPNNFYGWEGEDVNFLLRMFDQHKNLYINKIGKVIDIEENKNFKNKTVTEKLDELTTLDQRENHVYEKNVDYMNYKHNGLTSLKYSILDKFHYTNNYHIIIDPLYSQCYKQNPELYDFKPVSKDQYKTVKNHILKIKQIPF